MMGVAVALGVARVLGGPDWVSLVSALTFLAGGALVLVHLLRTSPAGATNAGAPSSYVGAHGHHEAILDALIAAHPPGTPHVRLVLRPQGTRYEPELTTLGSGAVPPSVRKPIEALAAFLRERNEPLDRLILEAKMENDGTWQRVVDVGREAQRK